MPNTDLSIALPPPDALPAIHDLPELLRFADGSPVLTPEDWAKRRQELLTLYSHYLYGTMPDKANEQLAYTLSTDPVTGKTLLTITMTMGEKSASFSVLVTLPEGAAPASGFPCFVEYMPHHYQNWFTKEWVTEVSRNCRYAASRGYAGINYDCQAVAKDNESFTGAFYTLYPYHAGDAETCNGTLLAWAWGISKVIDALEQGAGAALGIDPELVVVAGVSRYGKSAAVAGAYDERIRAVIPACSGAGGTAVFRMSNAGKAYDLTSLDGPSEWINESPNEPLSNLQGGEGYWFCSRFAAIPSVEQIPVDQHMLVALTAHPRRHMLMVTGITSEGWNNTEGQCLAYAAAQPVWDLLGCGKNNNLLVHLDGHAVVPEDMQLILDYCDAHLLGKPMETMTGGPSQMKGEVFLVHNRDRLHPAFAPYVSK